MKLFEKIHNLFLYLFIAMALIICGIAAFKTFGLIGSIILSIIGVPFVIALGYGADYIKKIFKIQEDTIFLHFLKKIKK